MGELLTTPMRGNGVVPEPFERLGLGKLGMVFANACGTFLQVD